MLKVHKYAIQKDQRYILTHRVGYNVQITLIVAGKLDPPEAEAEGRVCEAFLALLADRFIERAVPCDLPLPPPPVFAKLTVGF